MAHEDWLTVLAWRTYITRCNWVRMLVASRRRSHGSARLPFPHSLSTDAFVGQSEGASAPCRKFNSPARPSLSRIVSPLGLRVSGQRSPRPSHLSPRQSEFWVFASAEEAASDDGGVLQDPVLEISPHNWVRTQCCWISLAGLHEMMTNAAQHSHRKCP